MVSYAGEDMRKYEEVQYMGGKGKGTPWRRA
jgi:hypothetical protein